jgi:hypothetical protein
MYGLYDAIGSIDNHLVPATGGNAYIRRAYSRSGLSSWRYRFDQSLGGDPGATITVGTFSFIKVTHSGGVMTLDHRLVGDGGDITTASTHHHSGAQLILVKSTQWSSLYESIPLDHQFV